jgi:hypothetical protein
MLARFSQYRRLNSQLTPKQRQLVDLLTDQASIWLSAWVKTMTARPNRDPEQFIKYHFYDALDYALLSVRGRSHYYTPDMPEGVDDQDVDEKIIGEVYNRLIVKFRNLSANDAVPKFNVEIPEFDYGQISGDDFVRQAKYVLSNKHVFENFGVEEAIRRLNVAHPWIKSLAKNTRTAQEFLSGIEKVYNQAVNWTGKAKLFPSKVEVFSQGNYASIFLSFPDAKTLATAIGSTEDMAEQILTDINKNTQGHYNDVIGWTKFFKHPNRHVWIVREIQSDVLQNWSNLKRTGPLKQTDLYTGQVYNIGSSERAEWIDQYNSKLENLFRDFDKLLVNMLLEAAEKNGVEEVWLPTGSAVAGLYGRFVGPEAVGKLERLYDGVASKFNSSDIETFEGLTYHVLRPDQALVKTLRASKQCRSLLASIARR